MVAASFEKAATIQFGKTRSTVTELPCLVTARLLSSRRTASADNLVFPNQLEFLDSAFHPIRFGVGNSSVNFVPRPSSLCTSIKPPWASMIFRVVGRPRPEPPFFVE